MQHLDLLELLNDLYQRYMPETVYLVKNQPRHEQAMRTIEALIDRIAHEDDAADFNVKKDELIGTSIALEVTTVCFSTVNLAALCDLLQQADSLDVTPLVDGRVRLTIGFDNVYKPYDPCEK